MLFKISFGNIEVRQKFTRFPDLHAKTKQPGGKAGLLLTVKHNKYSYQSKRLESIKPLGGEVLDWATSPKSFIRTGISSSFSEKMLLRFS